MSGIELSGSAATTAPRGDAVLAVDLAGTVTYVNRVAELVTGRARNELLGHPLAYLLETAEGAARGGWGLLWILSELSAEPIHDREGRVTGAMVVFRDVVARFGVQSKSIAR